MIDRFEYHPVAVHNNLRDQSFVDANESLSHSKVAGLAL